MEEPTFTAIDYNSLENKVIEGLVRDNYSKIKNTFFYEIRNGRRVLGKDRVKKILDTIL